MTGKEFRIKLLKANIKQKDLPDIFKVSLKTVSNICGAATVPMVYELALIGYLALVATREGDKV